MKTQTPTPVQDAQEMRAWSHGLSSPPQGEVKWMLVEALLTLLLSVFWP